MQLYHCNAGFPVVDEGSELHVPSRKTTTDYGVPIEGYRTLSGPIADFTEACFEHELAAEPGGTRPGRRRQPARSGWASTRSSGSTSSATTRSGG